ncbi:MAG: dTDP-4-amino-4,6-dideoxygalactose transaminase [Gammaproteobacteria bacterium]|nr:MAG: dTDP-4-amino-4,6-dideoxygalactose transaminase [Gammaproteobacteria bacterium]
MKNIPFNRPCWTGEESEHIKSAIENGWISGDGPYTKKVQETIKQYFGSSSEVLLTTSCTHALEISAILLDLKPGDEVIVPSYTFVSTALAYLMHGATPVFVDIKPDTLNIDERLIEASITSKTRAIVPVHYAGVACEMDVINEIASRYDLTVIEDDAHGLCGKYHGRYLGSLGDIATQSFHETKNITCGEGGALVLNSEKYIEQSEIIREKGTDRSKFFRGQIDKYSWVDKGSSYVMSDLLAAFLYGQLVHIDAIQEKRKNIWQRYDSNLNEWAKKNDVTQPFVPDHCEQAYHMYYLLMPDIETRTRFIQHLKTNNIGSAFHYVPLHSSKMGKEYCKTKYEMKNTNEVSSTLIRLPFFNDYDAQTQLEIIEVISGFQV